MKERPTFGWFFQAAEKALQAAIAAVIFSLMLITFVDVLGRYLFSRPILGADELISCGMALIIFGALPLVSIRNEQITADFAATWIRGEIKRLSLRFVQLCSAVALAFLAHRLYALAGKQWGTEDSSTLLSISYYQLSYFMSAMSAISALICIKHALAPVPPRPQVETFE